MDERVGGWISEWEMGGWMDRWVNEWVDITGTLE